MGECSKVFFFLFFFVPTARRLSEQSTPMKMHYKEHCPRKMSRQRLLILSAAAIIPAIFVAGLFFAKLEGSEQSHARTTHFRVTSAKAPSVKAVVTKKSEEATQAGSFNFRQHFDGAPLCHVPEEQDIDFTLAIQISYSRLWIMQHHCKRWGNNHISLAVAYQREKETIETLERLRVMGCDMQRMKVSFFHHLDASNYPANRLRNLALSKVNTTHTITVDGDVLVSSNLHDALVKYRSVLASDDKLALVIPAFQVLNVCKPTDSQRCRRLHLSMVPHTKAELLQGYEGGEKKRKIMPLKAQSTTCSSSWRVQTADDLYPIACFISDDYEPYLAIRYCRETPPFQEAFNGFGENKVTRMHQLRRAGFAFFRIGEGFCVHVPHKKSRASKNELKQKDRTEKRQAFQRWMEANVPNKARTPMCKKKQKKCQKGGGAQESSLTNMWVQLLMVDKSLHKTVSKTIPAGSTLSQLKSSNSSADLSPSIGNTLKKRKRKSKKSSTKKSTVKEKLHKTTGNPATISPRKAPCV
jgi:hypothetical protein